MDLIIQIFAVLSVLSCLFMAAYSYGKEVKREKLAYLNARAEVAGMFDRLDCRVDDMQSEQEVDNMYDYRLPAMNAPRGGIRWEQPKSDPSTAYLDDVVESNSRDELYKNALKAMRNYNNQIMRIEVFMADSIVKPVRIYKVPPYESSDL